MCNLHCQQHCIEDAWKCDMETQCRLTAMRLSSWNVAATSRIRRASTSAAALRLMRHTCTVKGRSVLSALQQPLRSDHILQPSVMAILETCRQMHKLPLQWCKHDCLVIHSQVGVLCTLFGNFGLRQRKADGVGIWAYVRSDLVCALSA